MSRPQFSYMDALTRLASGAMYTPNQDALMRQVLPQQTLGQLPQYQNQPQYQQPQPQMQQPQPQQPTQQPQFNQLDAHAPMIMPQQINQQQNQPQWKNPYQNMGEHQNPGYAYQPLGNNQQNNNQNRQSGYSQGNQAPLNNTYWNGNRQW